MPYIIIGIIVLVILAISLYYRLTRQLAPKPTTEVLHHTFDQIVTFNEDDPSFEAQSPEWQEKMQACGQVLAKNKVGLVVFTHGTFVGEDPLGLIPALERLSPRFKPHKLSNQLKEFNRSFWAKKLTDQGYFHPDYVELFEQSLGQDIPCINFRWTSGNYHAARFSGAINLIQLISANQKEIKDKRVLLIGHSHAGQVFALIANLLADSPTGKALKQLLQEEGIQIEEDLAKLKDLDLDFVTLGTPYIYDWPKADQYQPINLINHRNHPYLGGSRTGVLHTRDGDYIQQWGIAGSDLLATTSKERKLNKKLSEILGDTTNLILWRRNVSAMLRVPPHGKTHLIDYKDDSKILPNCISTMFGHGVYTTYEAMLFNTDLICRSLYNTRN